MRFSLLRYKEAFDLHGDRLADHVLQLGAQIHTLQHLGALGIDDAALLVEHVVIFQHRFPALKVHAFHALLRAFNGARQHPRLDLGVFGQTETLGQKGDPVRAEQPHQIVLHRDEELGFAGVALTAGTAAELVVDPAALVPLGAEDEQTSGLSHAVGLGGDLFFIAADKIAEDLPRLADRFVVGVGHAHGLFDDRVFIAAFAHLGARQKFRVASQHDIGTAPGHVGGNGHGALLAGLRHDLGFALVMLGVEDGMADAFGGQQFRQLLRALDGNGADQHRLAFGMTFFDPAHDGRQFPGMAVPVMPDSFLYRRK